LLTALWTTAYRRSWWHRKPNLDSDNDPGRADETARCP
jgi:hypothetical protein